MPAGGVVLLTMINPQLEARLKSIVLSKTEDSARDEWQSGSCQAKPLFDYRGDHVELVVSTAKYLAEKVNADMETVTLAAWLHDIAKPGLGGVKEHGKKSAEYARDVLAEEEVRGTVIERVCDAIEKHVGLTLEESLEPVEAQVLWEADKLVKLGAIGVTHFLVNGIRLKPGQKSDDLVEELEGFIPLAKRIESSMQTETAKVLAADRLRVLIDFTRALRRETGLGE